MVLFIICQNRFFLHFIDEIFVFVVDGKYKFEKKREKKENKRERKA